MWPQTLLTFMCYSPLEHVHIQNVLENVFDFGYSKMKKCNTIVVKSSFVKYIFIQDYLVTKHICIIAW